MISSVAALALLAPLASAITFTVPNNLTSGGQATITWTTSSGDPDVWSLELVNQDFHDTFGIVNNVQNSAQSITFELPSVPVTDGYTIEAVNITNINDVFATSGSFSIAAPVSVSSSSALSTSGSAVSSGAPSGSSTTSIPVSVTVPAPSSFVTSGSSGASSSGSSTSSSASVSPSSFGNGNSGAMSVAGSIGSWFAAAVAAVAGGVFVL